MARRADDGQAGGKLFQDLATHPAWRGWLFRLGRDEKGLEGAIAARYSGRNGAALGADSSRIRRIFDITAFADAAIGRQERRSDTEVRVGRVRTLHRGEGSLPKDHQYTIVAQRR